MEGLDEAFAYIVFVLYLRWQAWMRTNQIFHVQVSIMLIVARKHTGVKLL